MSTHLNETDQTDQTDEVYDLEAARRAREVRATEPTVDPEIAVESADEPIALDTPTPSAGEAAQNASEATTDPKAIDPEATDDKDDDDVPVLVEGEVLAVRDDSATVAQRAAAPRREVLPGWAKSRDAAKAAVVEAASYYGHLAAYHGVRVPLYYGKVSARSPWGLWRVIGATWGWIVDAADKENRMNVRGNTLDAGAYLRLKEDHRRQVAARTAMTIAAALVAASLVAAVLLAAPLLVQLVLAVAVLAEIGRAHV